MVSIGFSNTDVLYDVCASCLHNDRRMCATRQLYEDTECEGVEKLERVKKVEKMERMERVERIEGVDRREGVETRERREKVEGVWRKETKEVVQIEQTTHIGKGNQKI